MDEIQKTLIKAGRKDLAQKYYKKIAYGYKDKIIQIQKEYQKLIDEFYSDLIKDLETYAKLVKNHRNTEIAKADLLFGDFLKSNSIRDRLNISNGIFGPNDLNKTEWTNTFMVKTKKQELEKLSKEFDDLTQNVGVR
jgi:hypothetical protein